MSNLEILKKWNLAAHALVGRTITAASYMSDKEMEEMGWDQRALVLRLDNGTTLIPMQDDEGNGPGAISASDGATYPVLSE